MTTQNEASINRQMEQLSQLARQTFRCNVLPHEVKNIADYDTDLGMQIHLPLLLSELHIKFEQLLNCGRNTYICCLPVEIDEMDNLVSPTHGHLSDWDFEAWLEQKVLKTQVLSLGSVTHEEHRFRKFKWLVQEPTSRPQATAGGKYAAILAYFDRHPLGSEMPVLTLLSTLPPRDRCSILEVILAKDPSNVEVYNKLSMAYMKNGEESKAHAILQTGFEAGELDHFTYEQLADKIKSLSDNMQLGPQKPSQSYGETLSFLQGRFAKDAIGEFSEFYGLLIALCHNITD